jgi:type VI secretion system secreted protein VgrG
MTDPKTLQHVVVVGGFSFYVREIIGSEEISKTWRLHAKFALDPQTMGGDPNAFDPDEVIKREASILFKRDEAVVRTLTGLVTECELSASISGHPEVEMVLEPRLALLKHRRDIRIHRNLDVPQIVTEVVEALGVKVDNRLGDSYDNRPYCVQWRESDYDYVMRLMEDEGIFYFFAAGDVMVLGDKPQAYDALPGGKELPFLGAAGLNENQDGLHVFGTKAEMTPGKVTLRDWNTEHPSLDMDVANGTDVGFGPEWYDFPGEYETPSEGARKARLHAEAHNRQAARSHGRSTCARLYPGSVFLLGDAPVGAELGEYMVRRVNHEWNDLKEGFEVAFECDDAETTYRPPRDTYVPTVLNPHTGIVCTNGEDIQCDHFGRVKVHFHWDRLRPYDDDCSHWIPSLQDNTGGSSGIPRKDWEVVCHFLEGDPDRPMVVGRVYNGDDVFREKLPHAKDRSSLTSATSPSRDSANEIRFEDASGVERIFMRAPKDMNIRVSNDQTQTVGNNNTWRVENNETLDVGGNAEWTIGGACQPAVENNQTWKVTGNREKKIGKSDSNAVAGDHKLTIGGNQEIEVYGDMNVMADNLTEEFGANVTEKYKEKHSVEVGCDMSLKIGGLYEQMITGDKTEAIIADRKENIGASHTILAQDGECQMRVDKDRLCTVGGLLKVHCKEILTLTGAQKMETQSKTGKWMGDVDLMLIVKGIDDGGGKGTYITMKDGNIEMYAKNTITINIASGAKHDSGKSALN